MASVVEESSLVPEKVASLLGLALTTFLCGLAPLRLFPGLRSGDTGSRESWGLVVSLSSCFGGGAFIAASLLDILPEVEESFAELKQTYGLEVDFPLSQFCVVGGIFLILAIEQTALHFQEQGQELEDDPGHGHSHSHVHDASSLRSVLLMLALSFHSVFEGLEKEPLWWWSWSMRPSCPSVWASPWLRAASPSSPS